MFSISTIASSTRTPTTSDSASSVTTLSVKPSRYIAPNVGMIDSGSAVAETIVARQSRRNSQTTSTASSAPSNSSYIEPSKFSCTGSTKLNASVDGDVRMLGLELRELRRARHRRPSTSPAPQRARDLEADHRLAVEQRGRALLGDGVADVRHLVEAHAAAVRQRDLHRARVRSAVCTVATVRTDCSMPPISVRPPEASCWICRNWREMSAAVTLSASMRAGSSSTRISRSTPPTRLHRADAVHRRAAAWSPCCRRTRTALRRHARSESTV